MHSPAVSKQGQSQSERGLPPGATVRGLCKLLVVAPHQTAARTYRETLRGWMPAEQAQRDIRLATLSEREHAQGLGSAFHPIEREDDRVELLGSLLAHDGDLSIAIGSRQAPDFLPRDVLDQLGQAQRHPVPDGTQVFVGFAPAVWERVDHAICDASVTRENVIGEADQHSMVATSASWHVNSKSARCSKVYLALPVSKGCHRETGVGVFLVCGSGSLISEIRIDTNPLASARRHGADAVLFGEHSIPINLPSHIARPLLQAETCSTTQPVRTPRLRRLRSQIR